MIVRSIWIFMRKIWEKFRETMAGVAPLNTPVVTLIVIISFPLLQEVVCFSIAMTV